MTFGNNHKKTFSPDDLFCFSHLRWDFVYQRPQHLMSRFASARRVFFIEEPIPHAGEPTWELFELERGLTRCVPRLPEGLDKAEETRIMRDLVGDLAGEQESKKCVQWFYTPMMLDWAAKLDASAVVYDCMDELSKFRFAPGNIVDLEHRLFAKADLVFTGGHGLYEAKRTQHSAVHEFPSSIDAGHFRQALFNHEDPADQAGIAFPRIGYAGVIDERIDLELLDEAAALKPEWSFVMIGPVVKIDPDLLPRRANIHYLGQKPYAELPFYFSGWNVGMMPFALNESTEFISPTKTPEYLAAGLPVVSTPIRDVVRPYGEMGLVRIASDAEGFVEAIDAAMQDDATERIRVVDEFLAERSWDRTFKSMDNLIRKVARRPAQVAPSPTFQRREWPSFVT